MRAVGVSELAHLPFVRHQLDPALITGAWVRGGAAVVVARRLVNEGRVTAVSGFGDGELAGLMADVADRVDAPDRVMVTASAEVIPARWPLAEVRRWHWMLLTTGPPRPPVTDVVAIEDPDEVTALLDVVAPDSHARPGTPGVVAWLGIRDPGRLVAVGAALRQPDGTGHVRGVAVVEAYRGRGLGRELSRALTRRAMGASGVCSLGVYVENEPALRTYLGLGYEVVHTFTSGPVASSSTSAVAPSR